MSCTFHGCLRTSLLSAINFTKNRLRSPQIHRRGVQQMHDPEGHCSHRNRQHPPSPGHHASIAKQCSECAKRRLDGLYLSSAVPGHRCYGFLQNRLRSSLIHRQAAQQMPVSNGRDCRLLGSSVTLLHRDTLQAHAEHAAQANVCMLLVTRSKRPTRGLDVLHMN